MTEPMQARVSIPFVNLYLIRTPFAIFLKVYALYPQRAMINANQHNFCRIGMQILMDKIAYDESWPTNIVALSSSLDFV